MISFYRYHGKKRQSLVGALKSAKRLNSKVLVSKVLAVSTAQTGIRDAQKVHSATPQKALLQTINVSTDRPCIISKALFHSAFVAALCMDASIAPPLY